MGSFPFYFRMFAARSSRHIPQTVIEKWWPIIKASVDRAENSLARQRLASRASGADAPTTFGHADRVPLAELPSPLIRQAA
jgi:hypothetical protein